jgi:Ssp1 endopeptidase immunity protein Rap1a
LPENNTMKRILLFALMFVSLISIPVLWAGGVQTSDDEVMMFGPTGTELLRDCSDVGTLKVGEMIAPLQLADVAKHVAMCSGYIAGVNDATIAYVSGTNGTKRLYCVPPEANMEQLTRVVRKSLDDNPSQLHLPSSVLVVGALRNAFPCTK